MPVTWNDPIEGAPNSASRDVMLPPRAGPAHHREFDVHILTVKMSDGMLRAMTDTRTDVIQGTLDMLILRTLALQPLHGFGIARRIEQVSRDVFKVNPGSLLTALQRLERAGLVDAQWRSTENARRARYYSLTRAGHKRLDAETADWKRRAAAVARLLSAEA